MSLFHAGLQPALDANGDPISGATWNFYLTETLTTLTVYADADFATPLGVSVTADAAGRFADIFINDTAITRAILKDAGGTTITDVDPVNGELATQLATVTAAIAAGQAAVDAAIATVAHPLDSVYTANPPSQIVTIPGTFNDQIGGTYVINRGGTWTFSRSRYEAIDFTLSNTATDYYLNYTTGSDADDGLSSGNAKKTFDGLMTTLDALAAGTKVIVHCEDNYIGYLSHITSIDTRLDGLHVKFIGEGAQGFTRIFQMREDKVKATFAWAAHGASGAWKSNVAGAAGEWIAQFDLRFLDEDGIPTPITTTGQSASTVETTEGTSFWDGTYLYVHMIGGAEPDPFVNWAYANNTAGMVIKQDSGTLLFEDFEFFAAAKGSPVNSFRTRSVTDANFVTTTKLGLKNCKFYGASANGLGVFDMAITVLEDCVGAHCRNDIFNIHCNKSTGTKGQFMSAYVSGCKGHSSGNTKFADTLAAANSDNIFTVHDGIQIIRAGCVGWNSKDLTTYDVGGAYSLNYGCDMGPSVAATGDYLGAFGYEQLTGEGAAGAHMLLWGCVGGFDSICDALVNTGLGEIRLWQWAGDPSAPMSSASGTMVNDDTDAVLYP